VGISLGFILEDVSHQLGNICGDCSDCVTGGCIVHSMGKLLWGILRQKVYAFVRAGVIVVFNLKIGIYRRRN